MSTYYKYAERDVANEIDWATIGKNFTTMLKTEAENRERRKKDIDDATTKTLQTMADVPVTEHMGLAQSVLDFSTQGTNQLQMLDKLLKSGQLRPDQFIKQRETLLSGTKEGFDMVKEMDGLWKTKMERRDKGQSSIVEQEIMALAEGFGDFSNMKFSINSADGTVMLAMGKKDPSTGQVVIDESPDKLVPITTLRKRLRQDVDKVDLNKEAEGLAGVLGEEIKVIKKGGVLTLADAMKKPEYIKAESEYIKGALSDPLKIASVLTDIVKVDKKGNPYTTTFDPNIAASDPSKILLIPDPSSPSSGRFTAKIDTNSDAYKQAESALRDRVRVMIDRKEEPTPTYAPAARSSTRSGDGPTQNDMTALGMLRFLYSGNDSQMAQARNYFQNRGIYVKRTPTGVVGEIIGPDKKPKPFNLSFLSLDNKTPIGEDEWVASASPILTGELDVMKAVRYGGKRGALGGLNTSATWSTAPAAPGKQKTGKDLWKEEVNRIIPPDRLYTGGTTKATKALASEFQSQFGQYDFTFTSNGTILKIETPSSGDVEIDTDGTGWMGKIKTAISNGLTGDDLDEKFGPGSF